MAIADDDIERIRSTVSIVDVIGQHVQLKRTGRNWVGLCPFHAERTPSFNVREETGRYKCFGCDKSGDVFTFVQEIEHTDFVGSVEQLVVVRCLPPEDRDAARSADRPRETTFSELIDRVESIQRRIVQLKASL